jgi:hypothetical protein
MRLKEIKQMIHHVHSLFPSEPTAPASTQSGNGTSAKSTLESFRGALSEAATPASEDSPARHSVVQPPSLSVDRLSRNAATAPTSNAKASATPDSATSTTDSTTTSGPPNNGYDPFAQAVYSNPFASLSTPSSTTTTASTATTQSATSSAASSAASSTSTTTLDAQQAYDNDYWASQPAAVQALRTMQDPDQKAALATQLAGEGYSIDVPIMVWGWDPSIVTSMRQSEGYTWVPSALQNPVEMLPGLPSMGNMAAYNPNNPPSGSISVS